MRAAGLRDAVCDDLAGLGADAWRGNAFSKRNMRRDRVLLMFENVHYQNTVAKILHV
jgi:hypothetical protein